MKLIKPLLFAISVLCCTGAIADERPEQLLEPPRGFYLDSTMEKFDWKELREETKQGVEYQCFDHAEMMQWAHISEDYRWMWNYIPRLEGKLQLQIQITGERELQNMILRDSLSVTREGVDFIKMLHKSEQERGRLAVREKKLELWIWRAGTAVGLIAAAAFGTAYAIGND